MGSSFSVEEPVQGFSTATGSVGIHSFVDLSHGVEQAPGCSWMELRVARLTPFMKHFGHLRRGNCACIQCSYHDVVSSLIVDVRLVVSEDSIIEVS
jgi:hypothetical protein